MRALVNVVGLLCVSAVIALLVVVVGRTKRAKASLTGSEEYRRLAEMAVTAQEHNDLRLQEIQQQLDRLGEQMGSVQRILKEVE